MPYCSASRPASANITQIENHVPPRRPPETNISALFAHAARQIYPAADVAQRFRHARIPSTDGDVRPSRRLNRSAGCLRTVILTLANLPRRRRRLARPPAHATSPF